MKVFRLVLYICVGLLALYILNAIYFSSSEFLQTSAVNAGLAGIYILSAITVCILVYFPVRYLVKHPRSGLKGMLIGIGVLLIFLIGYFMSPGEVVSGTETGLKSVWVSKFLDASLVLMYSLFVLTIVTIIYTEARNLFR